LKKEDVDILIRSYFLKIGWAREIKVLKGLSMICPISGFKERRLKSFAFARILCSLLQRGSAFAKGFGPIKWRGELRRNSAQDTPQLAAGSFIRGT